MGQAVPPGGILPLLKELFVHHGHMVSEEAQLEGRSGTVYAVPLLAESETGAVVIGAHEGPGPLTAAEVEEFAATVADVAADRGVLCHVGGCDPDAAEAAQGIFLWDRSHLASLVGEYRVAEAMGESTVPLAFEAPVPTERLVAESVADILPDAFTISEPEMPIAAEPEAAPDFVAFSAAFAEPEPTIAAAQAPVDPLPEPTPAGRSYSPWADMASAHAPIPAMPAAAVPVSPPVVAAPPAPPPASLPPPAPRIAVPDSPFGMLLAASAAPAAASYAPPAATAAVPPPALAAPFNPWNAPSSTLAPAAAIGAAAAAPPRHQSYSRPLLPVKLRPEDAHKKVRDRLYSMSSAELILHPVHLYDYECDLLQEGKLSFDTEDGRVQVHGSDKSTLDVDPDAANPDAPTALAMAHNHNVTERVLRIAEDRAQQLALAHVIKKHTRTIDVRVPDENHSLYYTERRKLEPKAEQVRLRPLGIFFRPVWRLHGDNGYVDVDAVDGRELDVQLVGSRHGAMILE